MPPHRKAPFENQPSFFETLDVRARAAQLGNLDQSPPNGGVDLLTTTTVSSSFLKKNDPGFGADVDRAAQRSARRKDRRRKELAARGLQPIARRLTDLGLSHPSATTLALEFPA
ncbi:MAG TPA: hypothetical protein VFA29_11390, partial [Candidatus Baltobacteraceae bacterium]|nr:hypothetical protein [Candidatus Baltobacteraceae bacterium]